MLSRRMPCPCVHHVLRDCDWRVRKFPAYKRVFFLLLYTMSRLIGVWSMLTQGARWLILALKTDRYAIRLEQQTKGAIEEWF